MKSIKFLAALAIPAMFAACTNEELVAVQEDVQQGKEFVGADLVGAGISINVGSGAESRLYGSTWHVTDQLGLGWVVTGSYTTKQDAQSAPTNSELYNNLMFYKESEESGFTTKGNVYKGWHFAYYPFAYMSELGVKKVLTVNPTQTELWDTDRYNTAFYLSGREFLSRESLDDNLQLKENIEFYMVRAINTIGLTVKPNETFTESDVLKNLKIKSIKIEADTYLFPRTVTVQGEKLAQLQYDKNGMYDEAATIAAVKESLPEVLAQLDGETYYKDITTNIDNENINLTGDQTLRVHTLPRTLDVKPADVVVTINVEGGKFTVVYKSEDESDEAVNNNATIEKFAAAYKNGGAMTKHGGVLYDSEKNAFNFQLTADMFEPYFEKISSEVEWNRAVAVADALGMTEATFNITKTSENRNWKFEDVDGDGTLVNLPTAALTVTGEDMILAAEGEWPAEGLTVKTDVVVEEDLTVTGEMNVATGNSIINKATIYAGELSSISNMTDMALNNEEGRVIVEFGAYVYPADNKEGVIAYEVKDAKQSTIKKINVLIAEHEKGYASVNTLIVSTTLDLNAEASEADANGRYEENIYASYLSKLDDIAIELVDNGVLITEGTNKNVKSVIGKSGKTAITNINVLGNIEVLAGEMTATDVLFNESNNIYVAKDATLNIVESVPEYVTVKTINDIVVDGTVNMELDVLYVDVLKVNVGSKMNIAENCKIICSEEYVQEGTTSGKVMGEAVSTVTPTEITNISIDTDGSVLINSVEDLLAFANDPKSFIETSTSDIKTVKLTKDLDLTKINWKPINLWFNESNISFVFDGNNKKIKNLNVTGKEYIGFIGSLSLTNCEIKNLTFENPTVIGTGSFIGTVVGYDYGMTTLTNVDVIGGRVGTSIENVGIRVGGLIGFNPVDAKKFSLVNCDVEGVTLSAYHNLGGLVGTSYAGAKMNGCTSKNNTFYYGGKAASWNAYDCDGYAAGKSIKTNCSESGNVGIKK